MLRVAICDDEKVALEYIARELTNLMRDLKIDFELMTYRNGKILLHQHNLVNFDVLFLDIDMPDVSGFEIAKMIRETSHNAIVIFVTAKHDLVYESFEYRPFYFVCKSIDNDLQHELEHVVKKLIPYIKQNKKIDIIDRNRGVITIPLNRIAYIQSDKHYLLYHLTDNDPIPIKSREILSDRESELTFYDFIKPHRRYLINMHHIRRLDLTSYSIIMQDGALIPISKNLNDMLFEQYRKFMRR